MTELALWVRSVSVAVVACAVSWLATRLCIPWLRKRHCIDVPNARSSHSIPTPRGGGIGISLGIAAGLATCWLVGLPLPCAGILAGTAIVSLAGLADDLRKGLPVLLRLILQFFAAGLVIFSTGGLTTLPLPEPLGVNLGMLAIPVSCLWIVGVANLYNFLDGIDGFAATQGLIAGAALACLGPFTPIAAGGLALCGACLGFLPHNWRPAKVFMGDVGSLALGFLVATLPFQASTELRAGWIFTTAICLWFFLADGTFTLVRRLFHGEKIWTPHRSHLYQRLVMADLRHDQVVLVFALSAVPLASAAVMAYRLGLPHLQWVTLAVALGLFAVYHRFTILAEQNRMDRSNALSREPEPRRVPDPTRVVEAYSATIRELPAIDLIAGDLDSHKRYRVQIGFDPQQLGGGAFLQALDQHGITSAKVSRQFAEDESPPPTSAVVTKELIVMELPTVSLSKPEQRRLMDSIRESYFAACKTQFIPKPR